MFDPYRIAAEQAVVVNFVRSISLVVVMYSLARRPPCVPLSVSFIGAGLPPSRMSSS